MSPAPPFEAVGAPLAWPAAGSADLWLVEIGGLRQHAAQSYGWLDDGEKQRAARFLNTAARQAFLGGRYALRVLLARYLQVAPDSIVFSKNAYGKPLLDQSDLKFNISHSGNALLIGVARCDIGVDVQGPLHAGIINGLTAYLSPGEADAMAALPDPGERARAVQVCWSRKEAISKAIGKGLSLDPRRYSVPVTLACVDVPVQIDGHGTWWMSTLHGRTCSTIATASAMAEIRLHQIGAVPPVAATQVAGATPASVTTSSRPSPPSR